MNVRTKGLAVLVGAAAVAATAMSVSATAAPAPSGTAANPYSPSYQHSYRHGAIPTLQTKANMAQWDSKHAAAVTPNAPNSTTRTLSYGGGVDGIGVTTGHSKVYLVFY